MRRRTPRVEGKAFTYRFSHETGAGGESLLEHDGLIRIDRKKKRSIFELCVTFPIHILFQGTLVTIPNLPSFFFESLII